MSHKRNPSKRAGNKPANSTEIHTDTRNKHTVLDFSSVNWKSSLHLPPVFSSEQHCWLVKHHPHHLQKFVTLVLMHPCAMLRVWLCCRNGVNIQKQSSSRTLSSKGETPCRPGHYMRHTGSCADHRMFHPNVQQLGPHHLLVLDPAVASWQLGGVQQWWLTTCRWCWVTCLVCAGPFSVPSTIPTETHEPWEERAAAFTKAWKWENGLSKRFSGSFIRFWV